ncbi:MAG: CBS domain-containing protein [Spirochaetaceae bacterium]|nr:CBS domain-containing protein [Spirochaetaceae bacterium]
MQELSLNTNDSHDVILDIIRRIKIKDVMTDNPYTISPEAPMNEAKKVMKEHGITGLPVVREKRIMGIISINDILNCLDDGNMARPVKDYMSKQLIVLEEGMPVSFVLTYFEKYKFRRFPVLNKNKELSGMITSRDINVTLLNEINKELKERDSKKDAEISCVDGICFREFTVRKFDFENAGKASFAIKKYLKEIGVSQAVVRRVSIAVYELEINQVIHSNGGTIQLSVDKDSITIKSADKGPGIEEITKALTEGYSTASEWIRSQGFGAGMGLPNVKKVSDDFQITSSHEKGTEVIIKIYIGEKNETS